MAVEVPGSGAVGVITLASRFVLGGRDIGGAVWAFPPGGGGGTSGTFSGGMIVFELGVAGVGIDGDTGATGPGGRGVGPFAVWLSEPGKTMGFVSKMLAFVFEVGGLLSARDLWNDLSAGSSKGS